MIAITVEDFAKLSEHAKPEILAFFATAPQQLAAAGILETPQRLAHFMAQVMTESAALRSVSEALSYSPERLKAVWPSHFPTDEIANEYAHNPEKLANFIYGEGSIAQQLGNTQPGDGYKFRGRGLLQITGRDNYTKLGNMIGVPLGDNPDLAIDPATALKVAIGFWTNARYHGKTCNEMADADDIVGVTHAVNGGTNGLDDRRKWLETTKALWANAPTVVPAPANAPSAPQQPRAQQPQQAPSARPQQHQPQPQQRGGTTLSAIVAFFTGAVAFVVALFDQFRDWLHAQRVAIIDKYHVDPLWVVAGIFVLAILWVIFVRVEHRSRVKAAAAH